MSDAAPGTTLTAAEADRLPAAPAPTLSETALAYARQALSPATRRAYGSHLRAWEAWCQVRGTPPAPAAPSLVANHLAERRRRHPPGLGVPPHHPQRRHRPPGPLDRERPADPQGARLAWEAGYRGEALDRITPHSLRAGCITTLAQASVHEHDIMQHSRHGSQAVMRGYIRAAATPETFTSGAL